MRWTDGAIMIPTMLGACGPATAPYGSHSGTAAASTTAAGSHAGGTREDNTGHDDSTTQSLDEGASGPDRGPRLDLPPAPKPVGACGLPLPDDCAPTWPPEQSVADGPAATTGKNVDDGLKVTAASSGTAPSPADLWSLQFTIPCSQILRAPVPGSSRFVVDAEVEIAELAEFEYTHLGTYDAQLDVELLNPCAHLQFHAIEVDVTPHEVGAPPYAWPELPPVGFLRTTVTDG